MSDVPDAPRRSWFGRNWVWVLPVGCLAPVVLCCGVPALIGYLVLGGLKSSDVYKEAMARAKASDAVKQALGEPVEDAFLPMGSVNVENDTGHADFMVALKGSKGAAQYHIVADKKAGKWTYQTLEVAVSGQNGQPSKTIELLTENKGPGGDVGDQPRK
jgi:hypothetical protein